MDEVPKISFKNVSIRFKNLSKKPMLMTSLLGMKNSYALASENRPAPKVINALSSINLELQGNNRLGLIGPNGAGKTTFLRSIAGVYMPTEGEIIVKGIVRSLLNMSVGLNMDLSPKENILRMTTMAGQSRKYMPEIIKEIAEFTELEQRFNSPIRGFSSGMLTRLVFGIQTALDCDLLLMDEWISTGDLRFHKRASNRLEKMVKRTPLLVLATHSEALVKEWCTRAIYLENGEIIADGSPEEVWRTYSKS